MRMVTGYNSQQHMYTMPDILRAAEREQEGRFSPGPRSQWAS